MLLHREAKTLVDREATDGFNFFQCHFLHFTIGVYLHADEGKLTQFLSRLARRNWMFFSNRWVLSLLRLFPSASVGEGLPYPGKQVLCLLPRTEMHRRWSGTGHVRCSCASGSAWLACWSLGKISVVEQHWNMACKVSGRPTQVLCPHLQKNELTLLLLGCAVGENACSAVCGNLGSHSSALNMETHALIQKPFQNCNIPLVSATMT